MFAGHSRFQGKLWHQLTMQIRIETFCYFFRDSATWSRKLGEAYLAKILNGVFFFYLSSQLWDLTSGKLLHDFKQHTAAATCVEFHPKEFLLSTASNDRFVFKIFFAGDSLFYLLNVLQFLNDSHNRGDKCPITQLRSEERASDS